MKGDRGGMTFTYLWQGKTMNVTVNVQYELQSENTTAAPQESSRVPSFVNQQLTIVTMLLAAKLVIT